MPVQQWRIVNKSSELSLAHPRWKFQCTAAQVKPQMNTVEGLPGGDKLQQRHQFFTRAGQQRHLGVVGGHDLGGHPNPMGLRVIVVLQLQQ